MIVHTYFPRSRMKTQQTLFAHPCYCKQSQSLKIQEACSESIWVKQIKWLANVNVTKLRLSKSWNNVQSSDITGNSWNEHAVSWLFCSI